MLWPQHSLFGLQRSLVERLGFLILALMPAEECQVMYSAQGLWVLWPQCPFTDCQDAFPEWFSFPVLTSLIEVFPGLQEQVSRFPKRHIPVVNLLGTRQSMGDQALTARPGLIVR